MNACSCCFTGHRKIAIWDRPRILKKTEHYIRTLVEQGVRDFWVGGALGYDTLAAKRLFRLRDEEYPHIKVILAYPFEGYTQYWSAAQQKRHQQMLPQYDEVICISSTNGKYAYLERNRRLVDESQYCICYCDCQQGGTAYTVRYALRHGRTVYNTGSMELGTFL